MFTKYFSKTTLIFLFLIILVSLPFFWLEDFLIYSESLSLSLFIGCIALYGLTLKSKSKAGLFLFSMLIALTVLTKSSLIPLVFLLLMLFIINYHDLNIWTNIGLTFLPFAFFIALYSFHNHKTIGSYSLFKFGDFARMMSVNFIIDETFTEDKDMKKALAYYCGKINAEDRAHINAINSGFETSPEIRGIYSRNCDNIYFYYSYLTDSLKWDPLRVYASTSDYVSKARKKMASFILITLSIISFPIYITQNKEKNIR